MNAGLANCRRSGGHGNPQPNDVDRRRIERALAARRRYRYVAPQIEPMAGGYRITSPCCSRNVDREGGVIDIARLYYEAGTRLWRLYRKDHARDRWLLHGEYLALAAALAVLNDDTDRLFWQ